MIIFLTHKKDFSQWCDKAFVLSQKFICLFGDYVQYSVIICVVIPIIIYLGLIIAIIYQM